MKPAVAVREVQSSGVLSTTKFGISDADQSHILSILRDKLYSNKILAVLREYSSNAWDAHRSVGKGDLPVKIVLPTDLDSSLIVRDFGPGLTDADIQDVYVRYGASTKRDTNDQVGAFGIGGKSAFAYNDQFTVTSWNGGMKRIYMGVLDESNMGTMSLFHEEPCGEETGIEIKIPVNPSDKKRFYDEARQLFSWFSPQPEINLNLSDPREGREIFQAGFISKTGNGGFSRWIGVMGCVPYRLDFSRLKEDLGDDDLLLKAVEKLYGALFFDIGEVDVSASREDLEYTPRTRQAILSRMAELSEDVSKGLDDMLAECDNSWDQRRKLWEFAESTGMPIPERFKFWRSTKVWLYETHDKDRKPLEDGQPETFELHEIYLQHGNGRRTRSMATKHNPRIPVLKEVRLVIRDTTKPLRGYIEWHKYENTLIVVPKAVRVVDPKIPTLVLSVTEPTIEDIEKELHEFVERTQLDGIKILRLSDLTYVPVSSSGGYSKNSKHSKRVFTLDRIDDRPSAPFSRYWKTAPEIPEGSVFAIISHFLPRDRSTSQHAFWETVYKDRQILRHVFREELPVIYGVKDTEKRPVTFSDVAGVPYDEWARAKYNELMADKTARDAVETAMWFRRDHVIFGLESRKGAIKSVGDYLKSKLDGRHRLVHIFRKYVDAMDVVSSLEPNQKRAINNLADRWLALQKTEPDRRLKSATKRRSRRFKERYVDPYQVDVTLGKFYERYPLLDPQHGGPGLKVFLNRTIRDLWIEYLETVDYKLKK